MSTPKRAAKKTTTTKAAAAKKPAAKTKVPAKAGKSSVKKIVKAAVKKVVKKAVRKTASASKAVSKAASKTAAKTVSKKTAKKVVKKATTTAQKVARKIAKIITKVVAKKKSSAAGKSASTVKTSAATAPKKAAAKKTATPKHASAKASKAPAPRRPKTFSAREAERAYGFPPDVPELPETYGEDRLVLMTKDPEYLFAYWELTPGRVAAGEKSKRQDEQYREAIRLNWAARDIFERNFAVLPVSLDARKWYLRVPFSGLSYQIEIGWLGESGRFISLLASNPSDAPESWNATRRRLKHAAGAGGVLGRAFAAGGPQGSSDLSSPAPNPEASSAPLDWNFTGPGSQTSSFGAKKPAKTSARTTGQRPKKS